MSYRRKQSLKEYDYTVRLLDSEGEEEVTTALARTIKIFRHNPIKFFPRKLNIATKARGMISFSPNRMQRRIYHRYIKPKLPRPGYDGEPIRLYILKGRQLGCSTLIQAFCYWLISLFCNVRALTVAHSKDKAAEIFGMSKLFHASAGSFRPTFKRSNKNELYFANPREDEEAELGLESWCKVQTIDDKNLGVGSTLHFLHLSEFARYESINKDALTTIATLKQSVPDLPLTFVIMESTAYGEGYAKEEWEDDKNGLTKIFISWVCEWQYRSKKALEPLELLTHEDSPYGDELEVQRLIVDQLIEWYPKKAKQKGWAKKESLHRLAWRRNKIDKDFKGDVKLFNQEYPLTPEEAFLVSGQRVFSTHSLTLMKKRAETISSIAYEFIPSNYHSIKPGHFEETLEGRLLLREDVTEGINYFISADVSEGLPGSDYSVLHLFDEEDRQVGRFRGLIEPDELADLLFTLARIFNDAFIIPEANVAGLTTITRLTKHYKYGKVYRRKRIDKIAGQPMQVYGFYTSPGNRQYIINLLRAAVKNLELDLFCPDTIKELLSFQKNEKGKMVAPTNGYDDCVMSLALYCLIRDLTPEETRQKEIYNDMPFDYIEHLLGDEYNQQAFFGGY